MSLKEHNKFTDELYVLGVLEEFQNEGIGKKLLKNVEKKCKKNGKKYLTVKTLGPSHEDKNYKNTRKFYEKAGFIPIEETTELWGEKNPCLIMVKDLETCN